MTPEDEIAHHEDAFIRSFILTVRRERLRHELKKDRQRFINRFCHNATELLDPRYLIEIPPPNSSPEDLRQLLLDKGASKRCYALAAHPDVEGTLVDLKTALETSVGSGPTILSCVAGELAYLESEQEFGPPPRYLLYRPHEDRTTR
ncbi:hypothetical protein [Luteolibacter luteus]|uniref:Uncharacterized protein n=1 Tax=Luteolibacter luteus TaxID=2728835 RepID=A0A858RPC7_9BACT|nr:hypothetical protein [Luteolibacter luteus]QJE98595.1 hypothetical protein HHL09_23365 [Luteolibacter luteus]